MHSHISESLFETPMVEIKKIAYYMNRLDKRGEFFGLINEGNCQEVNFVKTQANKMRGGHFHIKTNEIIFLLTGKVKVELFECNDVDKKYSLALNAGEGIKIPPYTFHTFSYLKDSTHIQMLDIPFDPENQDIHKLTLDGYPLKAGQTSPHESGD